MSIILPRRFFAIIIPLLKCTGEGEIFFKQNRVGRFGKSFKVIKFATMLKEQAIIRAKKAAKEAAAKNA